MASAETRPGAASTRDWGSWRPGTWGGSSGEGTGAAQTRFNMRIVVILLETI